MIVCLWCLFAVACCLFLLFVVCCCLMFGVFHSFGVCVLFGFCFGVGSFLFVVCLLMLCLVVC